MDHGGSEAGDTLYYDSTSSLSECSFLHSEDFLHSTRGYSERIVCLEQTQFQERGDDDQYVEGCADWHFSDEECGCERIVFDSFRREFFFPDKKLSARLSYRRIGYFLHEIRRPAIPL